MTVTPKISIVDGNLIVHGKTIVTGVPENVTLTPGSGVGLVHGAFIGATSSESKSHHVFPIGVLDGLRFMCCFRFKLWWMTQRMGICGKDVPLETQFMLLESKYGSPLSEDMDLGDDDRTVYTVLLPLLEGPFRAVLQGNERNEIEICLESGEYVYVWHALAGYWGGVKPAAAGMEHYDTALAYPVQSPGVMGNQPDIVMDSLTVYGLGLVHPKKVYNFYNELHSYLASAGVDGVKVDVQNIIETLGAGHGGRVSITRQYHQALEASITRNFPDNGCIACMCHNTDGLYSAKQTAVIRASDDFFPSDPASHTIHISSVAYNTLFLGEFMHPDWDMFHSLHPAAEYHGAARAVGGCGIYVSDKPGIHNFDLLRKLVLPDGSVLRAQLPGRPTRDCLFIDPARDGKSLLKIWNLNKYTGMVGAFNCQGAGWCKVEKKNRIHDTSPKTLTGTVRARDVDLLPQVAEDGWTGDSVFYAHRTGDLVRLPKGAAIPITLNVLEFELYTVSPVKDFAPQISFAPIGLINMFNSGGAIDHLDIQSEAKTSAELFDGAVEGEGSPTLCDSRATAVVVKMKVRGCGIFAAYSTQRPKQCSVNSIETEFTYDAATGLLTFAIPVPKEEMYRWDVKIEI